jgi:LysR family hydrogen peroxide-inducible transcriptional activator
VTQADKPAAPRSAALDPEKVSLKQLRCLSAIAETGSFRRAADRLGVTQPALTAQIAALEAGLGLQLFERSRRGAALSPEGRELLGSAHRVLEEFQGFVDRAATLSGGAVVTYRTGVPPTLGPYLLPHILPPLHRKYAGLRLYVRESVPRDLEEGLRNNQHDFIFTPLPVSDRQLTIVPLFREPLKLVMANDHHLAGKARINREDLLGEEILSIEEHHHFHRQVAQLCERLGAKVRRDFEGTSLDTLRHMVVMGTGMAFLPSLYVASEIHDQSELRVTDLRGDSIARIQAMAWRSSSPARALFRELAQEIREILRAQQPADIVVIDS